MRECVTKTIVSSSQISITGSGGGKLGEIVARKVAESQSNPPRNKDPYTVSFAFLNNKLYFSNFYYTSVTLPLGMWLTVMQRCIQVNKIQTSPYLQVNHKNYIISEESFF